MADVEIKSKKGRHAVSCMAKKIIRVDLTPMVDLGFLLITFFVFTTTMAKATVMDITTPVDAPPGNPVCNSCALTVLLDKDNAVYYYAGAFDETNVIRSEFSSVREVIQQHKRALENAGRNQTEFSLIIKSSDSSRFRNFVDITDEVTINDIKHYYIDELTAEEKAAMDLLHQ